MPLTKNYICLLVASELVSDVGGALPLTKNVARKVRRYRVKPRMPIRL